MDVRLDRVTFKALASSSRVDILKVLDKRRHTQAELSSVLNFSVPTVKEHLLALSKAGLVERFDEGRKWKYFALSKKGRAVLHPEELKIWIVLSLFLFSVIGSFVSWVPEAPVDVMAESLSMSMRAAPVVDAVQPFDWFGAFAFASIIFAVALIFYVSKAFAFKKMLGTCLTKK